MTRKVVFVGSTSFPLDAAIGRQIVDLMKEYGDDVAFLTRGSEGFDTFVGHVALVLGRRCFTFPAQGGADNWIRDQEMVADGDEVIVFLDPNSLKDPNTGTAHVLEVALRAEKPCRAFTVVDGELVYAGSDQ